MDLIGGLIVTHGNLAVELLRAAEAIEGHLDHIEAVCLEWGDTAELATERIREALGRVLDDGRSAIVFTDMFGGTPSNLALSFLERDRVEIITGVNLPMLVKFGSARSSEQTLSEIAHMIREKGARSIRVASEVLDPERREAGGGQ